MTLDWDKTHQLSLTARNLLDSESFLHFISKTVFVFALGSLKTIVLGFGHMSHFYNVKRAPFEAEKLTRPFEVISSPLDSVLSAPLVDTIHDHT